MDYTSEEKFYKIINSPVGPITLVANHKALLSLSWGKKSLEKAVQSSSHEILQKVESQLIEYFDGKRTHFDLPLNPQGTDFQKQAWQQLLQIPYGQHITYGEQARRLQKPQAVRAVGAANGKNPIGIIIPCHRVIGASGSLTGFAGGLEAKKQLLALESRCLFI